jgi:hypothetical protein
MEASVADDIADVRNTKPCASGEQSDSDSTDQIDDAAVFWIALPFILAHPSVARDQQSVCNLMASTKTLRTAVIESLQGLVEITVVAQKARKLAPWLSTHASLLASLTIQAPPPLCYTRILGHNKMDKLENVAAGEAAVADALQHAAAVGSLQLRSLSAFARQSCSSVAAALHCLPSSSLTSLSLALFATEKQQLNHLRTALAALTSLRKLQLELPTHYNWCVLDEPAHLDLTQQPPILPPLPNSSSNSSSSSSSDDGQARGTGVGAARLPVHGLQHLTSLAVTGVLNEGDLARLPCSLKQLTLTYSCHSRDAAKWAVSQGERLPLQWQQLRQLTSLQLGSCDRANSGELGLEADDVLPVNLVQLSVSSPISSIKPILCANQLQQLTLSTVQLDAQQLQQLAEHSIKQPSGGSVKTGSDAASSRRCGGSPHLTSLQLSYNSSYHLNESAAAWGSLGSRLQALTMDLACSDPSCMSEHVLQHLCTCQGLTRLALDNVGHIEATAAQFCEVLRQLTSLRTLELGDGWQWALRSAHRTVSRWCCMPG